jgi:hypothetical protein
MKNIGKIELLIVVSYQFICKKVNAHY